ncbi:YidC/Oxa1 family membrane protein insertase [Youngiibacter fragilis]|uniref:Preprotein translocase subunit YidC n=1 Tax=Youngiibacter fragilis 232.1 TaxID=994573 RepID=V7I8I6_9CLOT|nr:YidC/Oxa1 family membrane protein insertase [Youngiibacter fragilis]ETA81322.1 preprotein translocase subunit YidC [Youngiibacter fragilis 232.1]
MLEPLNQLFISVFHIIKSFLDQFVADPGNQWGFTIILFTVLINFLMFPLNYKQIKSMKKTQAIQPEVKKLQEKYKNDPQKVQEMTMKLYKDNNVSMFGGCLPLLITYPIFIAMFSVFRKLAEDGSITAMKFGPLIPDLGAKGNIVLSVLAVVTMILSTWLSQSKNKAVKDDAMTKQTNMMSYSMSLLFGFFTYTSTAALGLYWVTGNVFRIIQTLILNYVEKE